MVHDSGRLDTLIKFAKSCISPRSANKNILPICNASRCGREAWEKTPKCYRIVTVDFATQNARITAPLQNSAVGFERSVSTGAQSPKYDLGDFFCARCLAPNGGRAGAPSGAPGPVGRSFNPVRSTTSFERGVGGKQFTNGSPVMLKLFKAIGGMNIVPQFSFLSAFLHRRFSHQGGHNDI